MEFSVQYIGFRGRLSLWPPWWLIRAPLGPRLPQAIWLPLSLLPFPVLARVLDAIRRSRHVVAWPPSPRDAPPDALAEEPAAKPIASLPIEALADFTRSAT